ncbi:MAG TPA: hypothetical protein VFL54_06405 [Gammaproteobacteria bacterium]|nr:hypothetical protein [Gammaproteobacteria bacterium]
MNNKFLIAALLGIVALPALSLAAQSQPAAQPVQKKVQLQGSSLGTITVTSSQIQALQAIKAALHREYSTDAADADKLVCHISKIGGTHINKTLRCETNRQWWRREEVQAVQMMLSNMAGRTGGLVAALQTLHGRNAAFAIPIDYGRFHALMKALPAGQKEVNNEQ